MALAGIMQKLMTSDHFLLFTTHSRRIFGGTQETIRLLGVADSTNKGESDGFNFEENVVNLNQYISDDTISQLLQCAQDAGNKSAARLMKAVQVDMRIVTESNEGIIDDDAAVTAIASTQLCLVLYYHIPVYSELLPECLVWS